MQLESKDPGNGGAQRDSIIERSGARRRKKEICCIETKLTANRRTKREREEKWAETWVHLSKRREAQREEKEQKGYNTAEQLRKLNYFGEAVVCSGSDNLTSPAPPHPSSYRRRKNPSATHSLSADHLSIKLQQNHKWWCRLLPLSLLW